LNEEERIPMDTGGLFDPMHCALPCLFYALRGKRYEFIENFCLKTRVVLKQTVTTSGKTTKDDDEDGGSSGNTAVVKERIIPLGCLYPFAAYTQALALFYQANSSSVLLKETIAVSDIMSFCKTKEVRVEQKMRKRKEGEGKEGGGKEPSSSSGEEGNANSNNSKHLTNALGGGSDDPDADENLTPQEDFLLGIQDKSTYFGSATAWLCRAVFLFPYQLELLLMKAEINLDGKPSGLTGKHSRNKTWRSILGTFVQWRELSGGAVGAVAGAMGEGGGPLERGINCERRF
jgi:hypothetical protein